MAAYAGHVRSYDFVFDATVTGTRLKMLTVTRTGSWDAHGSGVEIDHNLSYGNPDGDYNVTEGGSNYTYTLGVTIRADPRFVAPASGDFHLQARSPAIDQGLTLSQSSRDFAGTLRPQANAYAIRAYERRR